MATINRFSKVTPNQYNPRSMQELMQVPTYKRQQHDNADLALAKVQSALTNLDIIPDHGEKVNPKMQEIKARLEKKAAELSSRGFDRNTTSDIIKLNQDYNDFIGPNGVGGKAVAAKKALALEKANYMQNATKGGLPADIAAANWEDHKAQYLANYKKTGKITNIDPRYGAKYINVLDEFDKKVKSLGLTSIVKGGSKSSIIFDPEKGQYVQTKGGEHLTANNLQQLDALNNWITNQINNPNSEIGRSLKEQRKSPQDALNDIAGYSKMFEKTSTKDIDNKTISSFTPKKSDEGNPDNDIYSSSEGTITIGNNYEAIKTNANLVLKNNKTPLSQKTKARQYLEVIKQADKAIEVNPRYKYYKDSLKNALPLLDKGDNYSFAPFSKQDTKDINLSTRWKYKKNNFDNTYQLIKSTTLRNGVTKSHLIGNPITNKEYNILKELASKNEEFQKFKETFKNNYVSKHGFERTDFFMPYDKKSTESVEALNALKSFSKNNVIPTNVSFYKNGKNNKIEVTPDVASNAVGLFISTKSENIDVIVSKQGNQPGFAVKFRPNTDSKLNGHSISKDQTIEMFIPVSNEIDPVTGLKSSPTFLFSKLPYNIQKEFRKLMRTSDLSASIDDDGIGKGGVPMNRFFHSDNNTKLDFKVTYLGEKSKFYTPYEINGENKVPMQWGKYLDYGKFNNKEYVSKLKDNNIIKLFQTVSKLYKSSDGKTTIFNKYGMKDLTSADIEGALKEVENRDIKLPSIQDIYNLSNINR